MVSEYIIYPYKVTDTFTENINDDLEALEEKTNMVNGVKRTGKSY